MVQAAQHFVLGQTFYHQALPPAKDDKEFNTYTCFFFPYFALEKYLRFIEASWCQFIDDKNTYIKEVFIENVSVPGDTLNDIKDI